MQHDNDFKIITDIGKVEEKSAVGKKTTTGEIMSVLTFEEYQSCIECHSNLIKWMVKLCVQCSKWDVVMKRSKGLCNYSILNILTRYSN